MKAQGRGSNPRPSESQIERPNHYTTRPQKSKSVRFTVNSVHGTKVPGRIYRRHVVAKSVGVEAVGCEQLAQSRYTAASWPGMVYVFLCTSF